MSGRNHMHTSNDLLQNEKKIIELTDDRGFGKAINLIDALRSG